MTDRRLDCGHMPGECPPECERLSLPRGTNYSYALAGGANARQVGGSHYKKAGATGEEHWDRVARLQLDYFQGNITKYVERWRDKNGVEDLHKARHYLDKYIEIEEAKAACPVKEAPMPELRSSSE